LGYCSCGLQHLTNVKIVKGRWCSWTFPLVCKMTGLLSNIKSTHKTGRKEKVVPSSCDPF
jgi:hypothetical protein